MCIITIIEQVINFIPYVLFEDYILDVASGMIEDVDNLKKWLFNYD